jgi:hypothetical protein
MMRRSDFTFLRNRVIIVVKPTFRRCCVAHPRVAPACVKELVREGDISVLFFNTPFCQMEVMCKAML